jgi:hypothetical protein
MQNNNNQRPQTPPKPKYETPVAPVRKSETLLPTTNPKKDDALTQWAMETLAAENKKNDKGHT